jgi:hypothetical protein
MQKSRRAIGYPGGVMRGALGVGLAAAIATGCVEDSGRSCDVPSDEMSVVATVVDAGPSIRAEIDFEDGDRTSLDRPLVLCDEDELTINGAEPLETERPGRVVYGVTFQPDADRDVVFELDRRGQGDRVTVELSLPPAFEILAPLTDAVVPRASDLVLEWDPPLADETMRIELGEEVGMGVCIYTEDGEHDYKTLAGVDVPDDGNWTIPGGSIVSDTDLECTAYYTLKRIAPGEYPGALGVGGYVEARVDRTVAFRSAP